MSRWCALVIALLVLVPVLPGAAAQGDTGTIIYRMYVCPYGYDEQFYPDVCTLFGPTAEARLADEPGDVVATEALGPDGAHFTLPPGTFRIDATIPGHSFAGITTTCTTVSGPNLNPDALEAGEVIECVEIRFPDSGRETNPAEELDLTLTIRARSCSIPIDRSEFHDTCFGNLVANAAFSISGQGLQTEVTTGADGDVSVDVPDFVLEIDPAGEHAGTRVWRFCSTAANLGIPMLHPLDLRYLNADVTCDIYLLPEIYDLARNLPDVEAATIEVHYRACPPGYLDTAYFAACHDIPVVDAPVDLTAPGAAAMRARGYTNEVGNLTFRVTPGSYQLPTEEIGAPGETYAVFCTDNADPEAMLPYPLELVAGGHVTCDLYVIPQSGS